MIAIFCIGLIFLFVGFTYLGELRIVLNGVDTEAKVINFSERIGRRGKPARMHPVFQYEVGGRLIEYTRTDSRNLDEYKLGDFVDIKYDPKKPEKCVELSPYSMSKKSIKRWMVGSFAIGIVCVIIPIVSL